MTSWPCRVRRAQTGKDEGDWLEVKTTRTHSVTTEETSKGQPNELPRPLVGVGRPNATPEAKFVGGRSRIYFNPVVYSGHFFSWTKTVFLPEEKNGIVEYRPLRMQINT